MPHVDFSQVQEFTPLPEGTYEASLSGSELVAASKTSGQPYMALTFTVSEGEFQGRKLFRNLSLQPQALWAFKQAVVRLGANPDDFVGMLEMEDLQAIVGGLVGAPCRISVGLREYNGELRNELKNILAPEF